MKKRGKSGWAAIADAIGAALVIDAALALIPGRGSIAFIFFHVPDLPLREFVPGLFGAGIVLRVRWIVAAAMLTAAWNCVEYWALPVPGSVLPFSLLVACGLTPALLSRSGARIPHVIAAAPAVLAAHLLTFGATDYRRPADAIVVFGAKAHSDGTPSQALHDRTMTAVELYREGRAPTLVMSGGGREPEVMKRVAMEAGVPESAIVLDAGGADTAATLRNVRGRYDRVLFVSHYYHAARIKMLAERYGIRGFTVPARQTRRLLKEPYFVARDCAAFVAYYLFVD